MRWLKTLRAIVDALVQDVRYALRQLRGRPGYAVASVLTLALGIGAITTVYSIANWIALRPVPGVRDQRRVVAVEFLGMRAGFDRPVAMAVAPADVEDLQQGADAIDLAAYQPGTAGIVVGRDGGRTVQAHYVTTNYFSALGVVWELGSGFTQEQARAAITAPVAVISHHLWTDAFDRRPDVLGRTIQVNGLTVPIVGVTAAGFRGPRLLGEIDLWLPGPAQYGLLRLTPPVGDPTAERAAKSYAFLFGRLAPGATFGEAEAQLALVAARLVEAFPREDGAFRGRAPIVRPGVGVPPRSRETVARTISVLLAIGVLMTAIALANAVNLSVLRAAAISEQLNTQRALGASAWRITRQRIAESLTLSSLGGVLGALSAVWLVRLFRGRLVPGLETVAEDIQLDWRVLGFTIGIVALAGLLLGVLPGLWEAPANLSSALNSGSRTTRRAHRLRFALTASQVALALTLMVGALLFAGTLRNLHRIDVGLDPREITSLWTQFPAGGYVGERAHQLVRDLTARLETEPGVAGLAFANSGPFFGIAGTLRLRPAGRPVDTLRFFATPRVSPAYFETLRVPLLRGRFFSEADVGKNGNDRVIILSASAAKDFFRSENPIGQTVIAGRPPVETAYRVVGVVDDTRWSTSLGEYATSGPWTYLPLGDGAQWGSVFIMTRTRTAVAFSGRLREILGEVAPSMPVFRVGSVADQIEYNLTDRRLLSNAAVLCSILAVLLAGLGLYAVVAFSVAERRREFGIRMALGAEARQILSVVLREGGAVGACGIVFGLGAAAILSKLIQSRLYGLTALEPAVYAAAAVLLLVLVAIATLVPANAATRVDPIIALRSE